MSKCSRWMCLCLAAIAMIVSLPSLGALPAGYTRLNYVASSGTQSLNTGIAPKANTRVVCDFRFTTIPSSGNSFCGWGSGGGQEAFLFGLAADVGFNAIVGGSWVGSSAGVPADTSRHVFDIASGAMYLDETLFSTVDTLGNTATSAQTLYLFSSHVEWSANPDYKCSMEIYSCQIYEGDLLVRDFVPVLRDSDSTAGLYDTVSEAFFTKSAGDPLIAGDACINLTVEGNPDRFGLSTPVYGMTAITNEDAVAFSLAGIGSYYYSENGGTRASFTSATCQFEDGEPFTRNSPSFSLNVTTNLSVTWNFNSVAHRLVAVAREGGTVSFGGSSGTAVTNWVATGTVLSVTAVTNVGQRFVRWIGDTDGVTNALSSATIDLPADRPRVVTAFFCSTTGYTSLDYVYDGLVLQLDGIDNAGHGVHDETATTWIDLSPSAAPIGNSRPTAEWVWNSNSVHVSGSTSIAPKATVPLDFQHVTIDCYSVKDEGSSSGSFFWVWPPVGRLNWYRASATSTTIWTPGINYADSLAYVDGPHTVRLDGKNLFLYSSDDTKKAKTLSTNTAPDTTNNCTVAIGCNLSGGEAVNSWICAFRAYDRALSDKEIRWNAAVDRIRFAGASETNGEIVVSALPQALAAPSPGYGAQTIGTTTNNVFTIGGLVTDDHDGARIAGEYAGTDVRYVYTGYTFTNGVVNPVVVSDADESMTVERISLFNDLVWRFRKEYRTIATSLLGGTVTVAGVSGTCVTNFADAGTLTIRATPDTAAGYSFFEWRGDVHDIADPTQEEIVVPVQSRNLVATYTWEDPAHIPVTTAWRAEISSGEWNDPANWDNGVPQKGDTVIISNVAANTTLTIPVPTSELALLAVGNTNGKTTTLVQDGWLVSICAETIDLGQGAIVTCVGACTYGGDLHRVHLRGTNFYLRTGAKIDVEKKGYKAGTGPCWPTGSGSSGGAYGGVVEGANHSAYGSAECPVDPGSGGNGGAGGGAVRLEFAGAVVIDGDVMANGGYTSANQLAGSGGGVWITSRTFAGTGRVLANSRNPWEDNFSSVRLTGGGGRIAVHYDTTAQNGVSCGVRFEARGGLSRKNTWRATTDANDGNNSAWRDEPKGGAGTIWFSDNRFLTAEPYATSGWKFAGVWCSPTPIASLNIEGDLFLDASYVIFPASPFALTVGGKLKATGVGFYAQRENGLVLSNGTVNIAGDLELYGARVELTGGLLAVGGDATLSSNHSYKDQNGTTRNLKSYEMGGGEFSVRAAPTAGAGMVGATVTVGGTLHLMAKSVVKPYCDLDTGSIVAFRVKNLTMDADSYFDATMKGFGDRRGPGAADTVNYAASHGGKGGAVSGYEENVAEAYGMRRRPILPGSGAGASTAGAHGFKGGGVVYVTASDSMTLNGEILADANRRHVLRASNGCPGSSGGSVYLVTRKLRQSTGSIYARGGVASSSAYGGKNKYCTGGGGRIAIFYGQNRFDTPEDFAAFTSNVSAAAGVVVTHGNYDITAWTDETHSEDGTVYWGRLSGELIIVK